MAWSCYCHYIISKCINKLRYDTEYTFNSINPCTTSIIYAYFAYLLVFSIRCKLSLTLIASCRVCTRDNNFIFLLLRFSRREIRIYRFRLCSSQFPIDCSSGNLRYIKNINSSRLITSMIIVTYWTKPIIWSDFLISDKFPIKILLNLLIRLETDIRFTFNDL